MSDKLNFKRTEQALKDALGGVSEFVAFTETCYVITDYTSFVYGEYLKPTTYFHEAQQFQSMGDANDFIKHNSVYKGWYIVPVQVKYTLQGRRRGSVNNVGDPK